MKENRDGETGSLEQRRQGQSAGPGQTGASRRLRALSDGAGRVTGAGRTLRRTEGARLRRVSIERRSAAAPPGPQPQKTLRASEQLGPEVKAAREAWTTGRKPFIAKALARLVFIDETSTNTKLSKRTGWSPKGERYLTHVPFGRWRTQTFVASLRSHGLVAP
ncbi:MAG: hypothetical protein ABJ152_17440 [Nitratireductor sp.]